MQAREVLHKLLIQTCGEMHAVRREALETVVWAGLTSQRMTVTGLGRAIGGAAREKHNIKRADRLLSNATVARGKGIPEEPPPQSYP